MSDFVKETKDILSKCGKFFATGAKTVAASTKTLVKKVKYKTDERSDLRKHRELISELGERVYSLSRNGNPLPNEVDVLIDQLNVIEKNLDDRRTKRAAEEAAAAEQRAAKKAAAAEQRAARKAAAAEQQAAKKAAAAELQAAKKAAAEQLAAEKAAQAAKEAAQAAEEAAKSDAQVTTPAEVPDEPIEPKAPTMEIPEEAAEEAAPDSEAPKLQL